MKIKDEYTGSHRNINYVWVRSYHGSQDSKVRFSLSCGGCCIDEFYFHDSIPVKHLLSSTVDNDAFFKDRAMKFINAFIDGVGISTTSFYLTGGRIVCKT